MSFYDWHADRFIRNWVQHPSNYTVVKYPDRLRKRPTLIRVEDGAQYAVASFASDVDARRFVAEMGIGPIIEADR